MNGYAINTRQRESVRILAHGESARDSFLMNGYALNTGHRALIEVLFIVLFNGISIKIEMLFMSEIANSVENNLFMVNCILFLCFHTLLQCHYNS